MWNINIDGVSTVASTTGVVPVCQQKCTSGFTDYGSFCLKPASYKRSGRVTKSCNSNEERSGDACYPKCKPGYHGIGNTCSPDSTDCPSVRTVHLKHLNILYWSSI